MWRNREIRFYLLAMLGIGIAAVIAAALIAGPPAAWLTAAACGFLIAVSIRFTIWRYREIAKLSSYVQRISSGEYSLDMRDNEEGELSVLRNDIYKVTRKLAEQGNLLAEDKTKLADALADISHQLKTPLTSLMVMNDILGDSDLPEGRRTEFTRSSAAQLERIEWLVSSLLKLSKLDAGTVQFRLQDIPAGRLIDRALEPLRIPMDIKGQTLKFENEDAVFRVDLNWTAEALTNILKNCVEHTPEGGHLQVLCSENPLYSEICIEDNGKGIPRDDLARIFQRFYKGRNAGPDSVGIGLNLAHSIITAQNGTIEVRSEGGRGTRFTVKFYKQVV